MLNRIRDALVGHVIGFILIVGGWFLAVFNTAFDRFSQKTFFSTLNVLGLLLILLGAYVPELWTAYKTRAKRQEERAVAKAEAKAKKKKAAEAGAEPAA